MAENSIKLCTYRKFKENHGVEYYLGVINNKAFRHALTRFRVSNHKLMVEVGRRNKVALADRVCHQCTLAEVEDEQHFLLTCPHYENHRTILFDAIEKKSPLIHHLSIKDKFIWIMSNQDKDIIIPLAEYIHNAMEIRIPHSQSKD
jgi:hypothetical protein